MIIVHALFKNKKFDKFKKSFLSEGSAIALSLFNFKNELDAIRMKDILTSKVVGFSVKNSPSETAIEAFIPEFKSLTISERTYVIEYLLYKLDRYFDNLIFSKHNRRQICLSIKKNKIKDKKIKQKDIKKIKDKKVKSENIKKKKKKTILPSLNLGMFGGVC